MTTDDGRKTGNSTLALGDEVETLDLDLFKSTDYQDFVERRGSRTRATQFRSDYEYESDIQIQHRSRATATQNDSYGRLVVFGLLSVGVVAGFLLVWNNWVAGISAEQTDNAYVQADLVNISPQVTGLVTGLSVTRNQMVQAGDALLSIDNASYLANRQKAEADIHSAEAALANLKARHELQQTRIAAAAADIRAANATLDYENANNARYETLKQSGTTTIQSEQDARTNLARAEAAMERAEAQFASEERQLDVLDSEQKQLEAELARSRALHSLAVKDVTNTVVRAPRSGVVGKHVVQQGEYVNAGQVLMSLVPDDSTYVMAKFKETQISQIRQGMAVVVEIDAYQHVSFDGVIESIAPASEAQLAPPPQDDESEEFTRVVQRIPVKIRLSEMRDPPGVLIPGMSAVVTLAQSAE